ncbi:hypothetical protein [Streptomyces sp. NPDC002547]
MGLLERVVIRPGRVRNDQVIIPSPQDVAGRPVPDLVQLSVADARSI